MRDEVKLEFNIPPVETPEEGKTIIMFYNSQPPIIGEWEEDYVHPTLGPQGTWKVKNADDLSVIQPDVWAYIPDPFEEVNNDETN